VKWPPAWASVELSVDSSARATVTRGPERGKAKNLPR
jgi:hypothetical protein